jgi:uncharacterized tellurite resistance protein B-like protein
MTFTNEEKLAVTKALMEVVMADGKVDVRESNYLAQLGGAFGITPQHIEQSINLPIRNALITIKNMSKDKRAALAIMLNEMALVDNDLDPEELNVVTTLWAIAGIRVNDKGEFTIL